MKPYFHLTPEQERMWKAIENGERIKLMPPRSDKASFRAFAAALAAFRATEEEK